jgi:hypothetical protein
MSNLTYGTGSWDESFSTSSAANHPPTAGGGTVVQPTVLRQGTNYVLIEVRDGYQIWDRRDYFSPTPRGCPCDYFQLNEVGEFAAWSAFYQLEPVARTEDGSEWERHDAVKDEIAGATFCTQCGVELAGAGRYCSSCGAAVVIRVTG